MLISLVWLMLVNLSCSSLWVCLARVCGFVLVQVGKFFLVQAGKYVLARDGEFVLIGSGHRCLFYIFWLTRNLIKLNCCETQAM